MRLVTVDPSRSCYGVAAGDRTEGLSALHAVRNLHDDADTSRATATRRLWPLLDSLAPEVVLVERPPSTVSERQVARRGGATRGSQAVIGFGLGRAVELVGAWCYMRDVRFGLVENGAWRRFAIGWMRQGLGEEAARPGASSKPSAPESSTPTSRSSATARQPELVSPGTYRVTFDGCDHALTFRGWQELVKRPSTCPTCATVAQREARTARVLPPASKREGAPGDLDHKAPFVALARALYPTMLEPMIADARKRAKADTLDHELAGVADAADAALLWRYVATSDLDLAAVTG